MKATTKLSCPVGCNSQPQELPVDFLCQVFIRLPMKQLFKCMFVSKIWCSIIRQPAFIQAYCSRNPFCLLLSTCQGNTKRKTKLTGNICEVSLRRSLYCSNILPSGQQEVLNLFNFSMFDTKRGFFSDAACYGVTEIINGVFCAYIGNRVSLVNVFTGQVTDFLCPHIRPNASARYFFGFEPITGLYKLLCTDFSNFVQRKDHQRRRLPEGTLQDFYILTISGSVQEFSWRRLRLPEEDDVRFSLRQSISVNGALHWFCWHKGSISRFDLTTEEFVHIDANFREILTGGETFLVQFRGKVSLFYCKGREMIIHSLETDKSWTVHEATLPEEFRNPSLIRVGSLSTGQILLAYPEIKNSITHVYAYNCDNKFERFVAGKFPQSVNLAYLSHLYYVEQNVEMLETLIRPFSPRC